MDGALNPPRVARPWTAFAYGRLAKQSTFPICPTAGVEMSDPVVNDGTETNARPATPIFWLDQHWFARPGGSSAKTSSAFLAQPFTSSHPPTPEGPPPIATATVPSPAAGSLTPPLGLTMYCVKCGIVSLSLVDRGWLVRWAGLPGASRRWGRTRSATQTAEGSPRGLQTAQTVIFPLRRSSEGCVLV